jgi:MoxR-like ATPase
MFATIMKSMTPVGIRSTAIIPVNGDVKVFSRIGESRGIAGAWQAGNVDIADTEMTIGKPVAIAISPKDYATLQFPITPTVLLQKLGRTVAGLVFPSDVPAKETYNDIYNDALAMPAKLVRYTTAMQSQPTQTPLLAPPVAQPVYAPPVVVSAPVVPEPQDVLAYTAPPAPEAASTSTEAPLVVPELTTYYERTIDDLTETEVYDFARTTQTNVLLTGDAGTGKTSSARNYAAKRGLPFVTIECTQQIDNSLTQGRFVPTGVGNATRWVYSQLASAIQQEEGAVILLNELTRMSSKSASLFLRLLEERELLIEPLNKVIKVSPTVLFVADQNVGFGYTGTNKQDAALLDRFHTKMEFTYDSKIESKFIESATLLNFANSIREANALNDEFSVPMSTRLLKNFQAQARGLNFKFAVNTLLNSFPKSDGEREAIKMRFDAEFDKIAEELGVSTGSYNGK